MMFSSFTEWNDNFPGQAIYDHRADYRSWESTKLFLQELFIHLPDAERGPEMCSLVALRFVSRVVAVQSCLSCAAQSMVWFKM